MTIWARPDGAEVARGGGGTALGWGGVIVVLAGLTSFVAAGFFLAVAVGLISGALALRPSTRWALRVPLLLSLTLVLLTLVDWALTAA